MKVHYTPGKTISSANKERRSVVEEQQNGGLTEGTGGGGGGGGSPRSTRSSQESQERQPPALAVKATLPPNWYMVENPKPLRADEKFYYVNKVTNETTWDRPISNGGAVVIPPPRSAKKPAQPSFSSPEPSVYDRLTDPHGYTGLHKYRFDAETGRGLGLQGRDHAAKGMGSVGQSDSPSAFRGNTNTGTDEVIHDISQIVMRR